MANPYLVNPITDMAPAFPGMLADIGFTDKITVPSAVVIRFGTAVGYDANRRGINAAGAAAIGIALHDHTQAGSFDPNALLPVDAYQAKSAVSVIRRGRVWCLVAPGAVCTQDTTAKFLADGTASDLGTALVKARFLSPHMVFTSYSPGIGSRRCVLVELHDPTI